MNESQSRSRISSEIYRFLFLKGQSSRQEISQKLDISLPTTTRCLNYLQDVGLIQTAGEFESTGGRKATIYQCVPDARYSIGIDITANHLSMVLIDLEMNIIDKVRLRIPFSETDKYFSVLKTEFDSLISRNVPNRSKLLGTGISLPVIVGEDHKTVTYATVVALSSTIYSFIGKYIPEPYLLFNDSNSAGLAESWRGNYTNSVVYLSLSNSVGGALMTGRTIYYGDNNRGCEFGHMTIVPHGKRCYCGKYGCLDAYCTANALSNFTEGNLDDFFTALKTGSNKGFKDVFDSYMDHLALAVNNLRMCYDCDIILGGNVGVYMSDYIDVFRKKAIKLNPFEKDGSFIKVCHYKTEAAAVGAALYYVSAFVQDQCNNEKNTEL